MTVSNLTPPWVVRAAVLMLTCLYSSEVFIFLPRLSVQGKAKGALVCFLTHKDPHLLASPKKSAHTKPKTWKNSKGVRSSTSADVRQTEVTLTSMCRWLALKWCKQSTTNQGEWEATMDWKYSTFSGTTWSWSNAMPKKNNKNNTKKPQHCRSLTWIYVRVLHQASYAVHWLTAFVISFCSILTACLTYGHVFHLGSIPTFLLRPKKVAVNNGTLSRARHGLNRTW